MKAVKSFLESFEQSPIFELLKTMFQKRLRWLVKIPCFFLARLLQFLCSGRFSRRILPSQHQNQTHRHSQHAVASSAPCNGNCHAISRLERKCLENIRIARADRMEAAVNSWSTC